MIFCTNWDILNKSVDVICFGVLTTYRVRKWCRDRRAELRAARYCAQATHNEQREDRRRRWSHCEQLALAGKANIHFDNQLRIQKLLNLWLGRSLRIFGTCRSRHFSLSSFSDRPNGGVIYVRLCDMNVPVNLQALSKGIVTTQHTLYMDD